MFQNEELFEDILKVLKGLAPRIGILAGECECCASEFLIIISGGTLFPREGLGQP